MYIFELNLKNLIIAFRDNNILLNFPNVFFQSNDQFPNIVLTTVLIL